MHILKRTKLKCPHCQVVFAASDLQAHVAEMHPAQEQISRSRLKRLVWRQEEKYRKKRKKLRVKKHLESLPPLLCQICGKQVPRGQLKKHRIKVHGASKIILSRGKKGGRTQYSSTNIARPWQGGAPGLGKGN